MDTMQHKGEHIMYNNQDNTNNNLSIDLLHEVIAVKDEVRTLRIAISALSEDIVDLETQLEDINSLKSEIHLKRQDIVYLRSELGKQTRGN